MSKAGIVFIMHPPREQVMIMYRRMFMVAVMLSFHSNNKTMLSNEQWENIYKHNVIRKN